MYGLPEDFTGSFFVGREVRSIVFSMNMIELIFDGEVSIGLQSAYELRLGDDDQYVEAHRVETQIESSRLMQLAGKKVASVDAQRDGTLTLRFEQGEMFRCFDDAVGYESYSIGHGKDETIV